MRGEIIDALNAAGDTGASVLEALAAYLDGGDGWIYRHKGRIEWYPHQHRIVLTALPGVEGDVVRADAVLVNGAQRGASLLAALDELNLLAAGWWLWHNDITDEVVLSSSFTADTSHWWSTAASPTILVLAAAVADTQSSRLARLSGGVVATAEHPTRGLRPEPDGWLTAAAVIAREPGAALGVWVTGAEERELLTALNDAQPTRSGFGAALRLAGNTLVAVQGARHPELGAGIQWITHIPGTGDLTRNIEVAARLNTSAGADPAISPRQSGWHSTVDGIAETLFLPAAVIEQLQDLSDVTFGETAANILDLARRGQEAATAARQLNLQLDANPNDIAQEVVEDTLTRLGEYHGIRSVSQFNADWEELLDAVDVGLHGACRGLITPPLLLPDTAWGTPRSQQVACWGQFNPLGPTVSTLETIERNNPGGGSVTYLLHAERHPYNPKLTVVAIADGPEILEALIPTVLISADAQVLGEALPDWLTIQHAAKSVHAGFTAYGSQFPSGALEQDRQALLLHAGDPWCRARETARQLTPHRVERKHPGRVKPSRDDLVAAWVDALSDSAVVDGHVAYLRSAWEGARTLIGGNWDWGQAQQVAASLRARAARRIRYDRYRWDRSQI